MTFPRFRGRHRWLSQMLRDIMNSSVTNQVPGRGRLTQPDKEENELQPLSKGEHGDLSIVCVFGLFHDERQE